MGRHWCSAFLVVTALAGPVAADELDDRAGLRPPYRNPNERQKEYAEHTRALDEAQLLRSKARGLHDRADEMRQKSKDDEAAKLDNQAESLEERASGMEEAAEELIHPTGQSRMGGSARSPPQRP